MKKNKAIQEYLEGVHLKYFAETEARKLFLNSIRCCSVEKSESPDFLLIDNFGKKHGLEITNLCKNHSLCCFFRSLDNIVKKVFVKVDKELSEKFFVNLMCSDMATKDIKDIKFREDAVAEQIFNIIKANPNNPQQKQTYYVGEMSISGNHNIVEFSTKEGVRMKVVYSKMDDNKHNFGGTPLFMLPLFNSFDVLQEAIAEKEKKIAEYRSNCSGTCNLLVIYDPFIAKGISFEANDSIYGHLFKSGFDNIFLLELGGKVAVKVSKLRSEAA